MLGKIKKLIINIKTLIIILIILTIVGWGFVVYFATKTSPPIFTCPEKTEKLNAYAVLLDNSRKLAKQDKGLDVLETDIRFLDNGTLFAAWEEVVFGGNQKEDLEYYYDVIIDALKFFSK